MTMEELEQAEAVMNTALEYGMPFLLPKSLVGKLLNAARAHVESFAALRADWAD